MSPLRFDNLFLRELPGESGLDLRSRQTHGVCWAPAQPTPVSAPRLLCHSPEVARLLGLNQDDVESAEFLSAFSGNRLLPGMQAYATRYGGHQFGNWAGQLGDGRAIMLGEVVTAGGERFELQLKGAGPTAYSRRSDGRAVLRSSIREFLCSEAMHHLGVPTTRALSLVATGDKVVRDMLYDGNPRAEPGAIVCRVAPSFTRFGHFEILAAHAELDLLRRFVDFTIRRDFPDLGEPTPDVFARWFGEVCERTAALMVEWMRVGFVHGVMNTDNMSILGLTIDYGPYGWMDDYDPGWTPNTTDAEMRRYRFSRQPTIARWNLERLADALLPVAPSRSALEEGIARYGARFEAGMSAMLAAKFGLRAWQKGDAGLVQRAYDLMQQSEVDLTHFFRLLGKLDAEQAGVDHLRPAFYQEAGFQAHRSAWDLWLKDYVDRVRPLDRLIRREQMKRANPVFVMRNYLAQQAIDAAEQGDLTLLHRLLEAARHPYDETVADDLTGLRPDWAKDRPGCSMLSCSS